MRIPEVRVELLAIAAELHEIDMSETAWRIEDLERELYRRPYARKAAARRATPRKESIIAYARTYPEADYMQIANACGCNTGRVSEALAGFRE